MKNTLRNILLGGMVVVMAASCDLNLTPTTNITYEEGTALLLTKRDIAEFQNGVIASYRGLHYGSYYQTVEVMSECFNATVDFGNNYGFVHRLGSGFLASDDYTTNIWANHYGAIKNYNIALEQCEMVTDEELLPATDLLKGITLFCRASSYLTLARHFSADYDPATAATELSVPLILVYDQLHKPVRATLQEVYDQIITDLDEAEELLAAAAENGPIVLNNNPTEGTVDLNGQPKAPAPTVDAVKALKARYYLDIHEYEDAASYAEEVIGSEAGYALSASLQEMNNEFMSDTGNESLIRLYASKSEGAVGCTLYTGVQSTKEEGKFFQPTFIPSQTIINAYNNSDLRKQVWFPVDMYPVKSQGTLYSGIAMFTKYIGNPTLQSGDNEDGAHYCKPLMLAEMYLIAAEAYAMAGDDSAAEAILGELRTARKAGAGEAGDIMEEIKLEWLRETVGDGQRINCIKRWGDGLPARPAQNAAKDIVMSTPESDYTGRTVAADAHTLVWPIPSYEIKISPALIQNPGYSAE
jgi:hypothetical protein